MQAKGDVGTAGLVLTIMSCSREGLVDGFDRPAPHVAVASVRPFVVVVDQPGVELGLQVVEGIEDRVAQAGAEELVEHGAMEALDEAIGLRPAHPGLAVLDVVEREIEFERVGVGTTELTAIIGQHGRHRQAAFGVERQHLVVQDLGGGHRPLAGVQRGETVAAEGVDHGLHGLRYQVPPTRGQRIRAEPTANRIKPGYLPGQTPCLAACTPAREHPTADAGYRAGPTGYGMAR